MPRIPGERGTSEPEFNGKRWRRFEGSPPYVSVNAPILSGSYTFGGSTASVSSGTYFSSVITYGASTSIDLNASVGAIHLGLSEVGPFVTLPPDASHQSHFLTGDLGTKILGVDFTPTSGGPSTIGYAEVSVVGASVPEPSSVGLVAVGLLSCGGVAFLRHRRVG